MPTDDKTTQLPGNNNVISMIPSKLNPNAAGCLAKKKWCNCGHKFKASESPASEKNLGVREKPGYKMSKLGSCPQCGRQRELCLQPRVANKKVCKRHGGKAGRKPLDPVITALDEDALDIIAKMQEDQDKTLDREFYVCKYLLQRSLSEFNTEQPDLTFAERMTALVDRLVGIQEKQAKLILMIPPDLRAGQIEFTDPRVQFLLQEQFRELETSVVRGTLAKVLQSLDDKELIMKVYESLPARLQDFVKTTFEVKAAGAEVVNATEKT